MKILLVNPPKIEHSVSRGVRLTHSLPKVLPPINLLYIAAPLIRERKHHVEIFEASAEKKSLQDICRYINENNFEVIGLPAFTLDLPQVKRLCKMIRESNSKVHICIGGPHTQFYPEDMLESWPEIDTLVIGYGEQVFKNLVDALDNNSELDNIKGLVYRKKDNIVVNPPDPVEREYLDEPIISRQLLPYKKYSTYLCNSSYSTIVVTMRGCPLKCFFCSDYYDDQCGFRPIDNVIKELKEIKRLGIKEIMFFDDMFNLSRKRIMELCERMVEERLNLRWAARAKVKPMDEDMVRMMKKSGCGRLHIGFESGSNRVLKLMNKQITTEESLGTAELLHSHKIEVLGYFLLGFPGETEDETMETIRFARKMPIEFAGFTCFTPILGSKVYHDSVSRGIYPDFFRDFTRQPIGFNDFYDNDEIISRERKKQLVKRAYKEFYFSPRHIWYIFKTLKSVYRIRNFIHAADLYFLKKGAEFEA